MVLITPCQACKGIVNKINRGNKSTSWKHQRDDDDKTECLPTERYGETENCSFISERILNLGSDSTLQILLPFTNKVKYDGWISLNGMTVTAGLMHMAGPFVRVLYFLTWQNPGNGQIRTDFPFNRQTGRWESLPGTALAQEKVMPCVTEVPFCLTVRSLSAKTLHSHTQILTYTHTLIQLTKMRKAFMY